MNTTRWFVVSADPLPGNVANYNGAGLGTTALVLLTEELHYVDETGRRDAFTAGGTWRDTRVRIAEVHRDGSIRPMPSGSVVVHSP